MCLCVFQCISECFGVFVGVFQSLCDYVHYPMIFHEFLGVWVCLLVILWVSV